MASNVIVIPTLQGTPLVNIVDPADADVLCGRGGTSQRHVGNQTYRRLVNMNKGIYVTCLKAEKVSISRSIVAAIRFRGGRFLERDGDDGLYYDIGDKKAIEKTSQSLREGQPKLRQRMVEMGNAELESGDATGLPHPPHTQIPHPSLPPPPPPPPLHQPQLSPVPQRSSGETISRATNQNAAFIIQNALMMHQSALQMLQPFLPQLVQPQQPNHHHPQLQGQLQHPQQHEELQSLQMQQQHPSQHTEQSQHLPHSQQQPHHQQHMPQPHVQQLQPPHLQRQTQQVQQSHQQQFHPPYFQHPTQQSQPQQLPHFQHQTQQSPPQQQQQMHPPHIQQESQQSQPQQFHQPHVHQQSQQPAQQVHQIEPTHLHQQSLQTLLEHPRQQQQQQQVSSPRTREAPLVDITSGLPPQGDVGNKEHTLMDRTSLESPRNSTHHQSRDDGSLPRHPYNNQCMQERQELSQHGVPVEDELLPLHLDQEFEHRLKLLAPTDESVGSTDLNQIDPLPFSNEPVPIQDGKNRRPLLHQHNQQQPDEDSEVGSNTSYTSSGLPSTHRLQMSSLGSMFSRSTTALATHGSSTSDTTTAAQTTAATGGATRKVDRRRIFAKMKASRPASGRFDLSMSNRSLLTDRSLATEGTPSDANNMMLDSQISLMSNQDVSKRMLMEFSEKPGAMLRDPIGNFGDSLKREEFIMALESRRSLLSGLSKISDSSDVMSFISDLSKKIGNVSTRSIATSEISGIEEQFQEDLEDLQEESHSGDSRGSLMERKMVE